MTTLKEYQPSSAIHALWYGQPGSGKTVAAHTFPRTRTIDLDNGMGSVAWAIRERIIKKKLGDIVYETIQEDKIERGRVKKASALDRMTDTIDKWYKERNDFETFIIDSGTVLSNICINKGLEENQRLNLSKSLDQSKNTMMRIMKMQDWGSGMNLFEQLITWVRSDFADHHFILVCHEYEETNDAGTLIAVRPLLIGQLRQRITNAFGEVYHQRVTGPKAKQTFEILTRQDAQHVTKSRLGCLPIRTEANYDGIIKHINAFWGTGKGSKQPRQNS